MKDSKHNISFSPQLSKKGLLPWKFSNVYAMAAKAEPKSKDIDIVFKKYVGNTKDQWQ